MHSARHGATVQIGPHLQRSALAFAVMSFLIWFSAVIPASGQDSAPRDSDQRDKPSEASRPADVGSVHAPPKAEVLEQLLVDVVAKSEKSVVSIARVRRPVLPSDTGIFEDDRQPLRGFGAERIGPDSPDFQPSYFGAGVIVTKDGLILTNYHVIGDPEKSDVWVWHDRKPYRAQVRAADPWTDLAVLKIAADSLEPLRWGDSGAVRKGSLVVALGNPYALARDGKPSASFGIVSNLLRKAPTTRFRDAGEGHDSLHHYGTLIQSDALLPYGTSGGPLINLRGEMIGLSTALAAFEGSESTAGFAIPVDETFRRVVDMLKSGRKPEFGFLGVSPSLLSLNERQQGALGVRINSVVPGTPAFRANMRGGDVITHVQDQPILDANDLIREVSRRNADEVVELTVNRIVEGKSNSLKLQARLSKKYQSGPRKTFSSEPDRKWRGLTIDYATAIPDLRDWLGRIDPEGCVAVLEVEPDSPAWRAGLRPLDFISHVNGKRVTTPREFEQQLPGATDAVTVQLTGGNAAAAFKRIEP